MEPVLDAIRVIETEIAGDRAAAERAYDTQVEAAKLAHESWQQAAREAKESGRQVPEKPADAMKPDRPIAPRITCSDPTIEALCTILADNPRGIILHRDELSGWLGNLEKYGGPGDRGFWIEGFGGRPYRVDRVKNGRVLDIPRVAISVLGGIQPDKLHSQLVAGENDGMAARFLMIWPERAPFTMDDEEPQDEWAAACLRRLRSLDMATNEAGERVPQFLKLTAGARSIQERWMRAVRAEEDSATGVYLAFLGKLSGYAVRLALVLELLNWAALPGNPEPTEIDTPTMALAVHLLDAFFKPMAARAIGEAALSKAERGAMALARWIKREGAAEINASHVRNKVRLAGLRTAAEMEPAIERLMEAGWLRPSPKRRGESKGRLSTDFAVNPGVFGGGE